VVFYFEYPIEGTYISNPNGVNRSRTDDSLCTRPTARNGNTSNGSIRGIGTNRNAVTLPVESLSRFHLSDSDAVCSENSSPRGPPTSQSFPELGKFENASTLVSAQKHLQVTNKQTRPPKHSPTGNRRGRNFTDVNSDNDLASTGESDQEDNFSDSDTDDEWDGCEVTAV
jgi:hypothetical protein